MNERDDEKVLELLKSTIEPVGDADLKRDLWPQMLSMLDEKTVRASWVDWALIALLPVWLFLFPEVIPALIYHL